MLLKRVLPAAGVAACLLALTACGKPAASGAAAPAPAAAPLAATPTVVTPSPAPAAAPAPVAAAPAAVAPMREGRGGRRGGMGGGKAGGGLRAMLVQACAADIAKFCPGSDKPGKCLRPHKDELSASCQAARARMKAARQARMNRKGGAAAGGGDDE